MMINLIMLFIGILGLCFGIKLLRIYLRARHICFETYSNKVSVLTKTEIQMRNKRRIESLFY